MEAWSKAKILCQWLLIVILVRVYLKILSFYREWLFMGKLKYFSSLFFVSKKYVCSDTL